MLLPSQTKHRTKKTPSDYIHHHVVRAWEWPGEMARLEFPLLYKHQNESSISSTHKKSWVLMTHPCNSLTGEAKRIESLGLAGQPIANLVEPMGPTFSERFCLKSKLGNEWRRQLGWAWTRKTTNNDLGLHIHELVYTLIHMYTQSRGGKGKGAGRERRRREMHKHLWTHAHIYLHTHTKKHRTWTERPLNSKSWLNLSNKME